MAEHFRDFLDPAVDTFAEPVLHPEPSLAHQALVRGGKTVLEAIGGQYMRTSDSGQQWRFADREGRSVFLEINEPDIVIPALVRYRDIGLFYTYTGEDKPLWHVDTRLTHVPEEVDTGNPETDGLVQFGEALITGTARLRKAGQWLARAVAPVRDARARAAWTQSTGRTKQEIAEHYDLSQDVYTGPLGFLDEPFVQYSSGLLAPGREFESLEDLQSQKVESLARLLELDSAETLLEVGGGWGGLAVALARQYPNLHITSLTVSDEQLKRARQRAEAAGVADRVEFRGVDYRDLQPEQPYDRVVSVEMIEAVDWRDLNTYLDKLVGFVHPEVGKIVLQSINIKPAQYASQRHTHSFADTAIFPGGVLTPRKVITDEMTARKWPVQEQVELGPSYALTLREWIRNMHAHQPALMQKWLSEGVPQAKIERFYRGFAFYLAFSQAGFRPGTDGHLQNWQLAFRPTSA